MAFGVVAFAGSVHPGSASAAELPEGTWETPWSVNALAPVTPEAATVQRKPPRPAVRQTSLPKIWLLGAVRFYQVAISPADGASCMLYPTCSGYAVQSLRKHGPVVGFVMTSERVMRNHTGDHYPGIFKFGRWRNHDPVGANDFWFPSERAKAERAMRARRQALDASYRRATEPRDSREDLRPVRREPPDAARPEETP